MYHHHFWWEQDGSYIYNSLSNNQTRDFQMTILNLKPFNWLNILKPQAAFAKKLESTVSTIKRVDDKPIRGEYNMDLEKHCTINPFLTHSWPHTCTIKLSTYHPDLKLYQVLAQPPLLPYCSSNLPSWCSVTPPFFLTIESKPNYQWFQPLNSLPTPN